MAAVGVAVVAVGVEGYEKFIILLHLKIIYAMPYYKNIKEIRNKNERLRIVDKLLIVREQSDGEIEKILSVDMENISDVRPLPLWVELKNRFQ
jgi:hypothetical protein